MARIVYQILKPFIQRRAFSFLHENNLENKLDSLLKMKMSMLSKCTIGQKMGATPTSKLDDLPFTAYNYYLPFFREPHEGDFIYPVRDYVKALTSGTMGKPKTYLLPRTGLMHNVQTTAASIFFFATHNGEKPTFEVGDVVYTNMPAGNYLSGHIEKNIKKDSNDFVTLVPPNPDGMTFDEKVRYFVDHYKEIDIAYMTITTLLDEIYPAVGEEFKLKGLFTQDTAAGPMREKIKKVIGCYPSTIYGSTETMFCGLPSIEHNGGFFLDWRILYPEFIPEKDTVDTGIETLDEHPETIGLMDVEKGKRYQLIATPYRNDMTRYVMPDIFEVISMGDNILSTGQPVFKYYSRSDKLMVLHNFTRINEEELIQILNEAEVPYVDFTARKEREDTREYMHIYIELAEQMSEEDVYKRINDHLQEFDKDWNDLVTLLKYEPLKLTLLPRDSFKRYLRSREGMPRIARIGMRDERFEELMQHAK
jgi:phenylacetate-coenzyme A ligase PaaK-like adenylate-forming protein